MYRFPIFLYFLIDSGWSTCSTYCTKSFYHIYDIKYLRGGCNGEESACNVGDLGLEYPLEKGMAIPTPVFLPGEFHVQKSLVGYSPWSCKEPDMTERLIHSHFHFQYARR